LQDASEHRNFLVGQLDCLHALRIGDEHRPPGEVAKE
jgi:hypothetical protein